MKNDWLFAKIIVMILVVSRGYNDLMHFIKEDYFAFFNQQLSTLWYLPSVILAAATVLTGALFMMGKRAQVGVAFGICLMADSLFVVIQSLLAFIPDFSKSWYFLVIFLLIGLLEFATGTKIISENKTPFSKRVH
ncbi:hypothetical protein ASD24_24970 [Paenibacillus sp. Root52]|uniref:hypothetical protein n=1 Tax=Paenibacillus sp. Root52 TaxID=1736552 RepID=UPI0006F876D4|nr:hypothetical protein [Paenibacillus sp. Root52]KQY90160.1 hypothetical protein ASD24_24970 [Paenibacillus sp. Root52]